MLADAEQVAPQLDQRLWGKILPSRAETSVPQTRESIVLSHVELLLAAMQRK
jgi:hypothetical protein